MSEHDRNIVEEQEATWIAERQHAGSSEGVPDHPADREHTIAPTPDADVGVSGTAAATAGTLFFGPVETIVGAVTGAGSGLDESSERIYRADYDRSTGRLDNRPFEVARPAYLFGHLAGRHPELRGHTFEQLEPSLRERWSAELGARHGEWDAVRPFVRAGYQQSAARAAGETFADADGADSEGRASYTNPLPRSTER